MNASTETTDTPLYAERDYSRREKQIRPMRLEAGERIY
jgi:hypothetical protein